MKHTKHDDIKVAEELVKIGREQAEGEVASLKSKLEAAPWIYEMLGKVKTLAFTEAQTKFFKLVLLKQVKDEKLYREKFGMTWAKFCEMVGLSYRTIDDQLADLKPFKAEFLTNFVNFSGFDFRKIKYLGDPKLTDSVNFTDNTIIYNGETIPVTPEHADEIQALLEKLEEDHKKQLEDKDAALRAQKRISESKEDVIKKLERDIKRLEKTVEVSDLPPEEQEQIELLKELQRSIQNLLYTVRQKIDFQKSSKEVLRQLYFLYIFGSKLFMEERMALNDIYADADEVPWEIMENELPPDHVMIDNLPLTKGMGKAYKEKMDKRKT